MSTAMINDPRPTATEAQHNEEPPNAETAFDAGDRTVCLVTIYTYLLQRRTRRLVAQAVDDATDAASEPGDPETGAVLPVPATADRDALTAVPRARPARKAA